MSQSEGGVALGRNVSIVSIAEKLGISASEVSRAFKEGYPMNAEKRELIKKTAAEMGYIRNEAASRLTMKPLRFCVICSSDIPEFDRELMKGYREAERVYHAYKLIMTYESLRGNTAEEYSESLISTLEKICESEYDAVIISAGFEGVDPIVKKYADRIKIALVNFDVQDSGRVFAAVNDTGAVARIAAQILGTSGGKCAVFTGIKGHWTHRNILENFRNAAKTSGLDIACVYHSASEDEMRRQVREAFEKHPDITSVYSTSVLSVPICEYINENGLKGKVRVVASDVYERLGKYILDGTVCATLYQNPAWQTYTAVEAMYRHIAQGVTGCERMVAKPEIVIAANIDLYMK